jgi:iron(III) transport system substrate-binding protein
MFSTNTIRPLSFFFLIGIFLCFVLAPGEAFGQTAEGLVRSLSGLSPQARLEKLVAGAKKEGRAVFYGTASADDARQFLAGFKRRYPFLETGHYRAGGFRLVNKIVTEARGGRYEPDIIQTSSLVGSELITAGLITRYFSPERKHVRKEFYDKDGKWTAMQHVRVALGYNTDFVKEEEVPKSYHDLLKPRWKGKVVIDNQDQDVLSALIEAWGEEKAFALFKGLAKNEVNIRRSRTLQAQLLAAGEFQVAAFLHGYRPAGMKRMGAPIGVVTLPPFVTKPSPLFLAKHSTHPHAAILLYDYLLSVDCQKIVATKIGRGPVRVGVKEKYPELQRGHYQIVIPETAGPKLRPLREFFNKTFGVTG